MSMRRLLPFCLLVAVLALPVVAEAGSFNHLGRYLGWGWSNGYHAQNVAVPPLQTNWRGKPYGQYRTVHGPAYGPPAAGPFSPQGRAMMHSDGPISSSHDDIGPTVPLGK